MVIVNFNRNLIFLKKVILFYYFEYFSLKNMNFMGLGCLCLFWEGVGVNKNIFCYFLFLCIILFKGYRIMVFWLLINEIMLSFLYKFKIYNV